MSLRNSCRLPSALRQVLSVEPGPQPYCLQGSPSYSAQHSKGYTAPWPLSQTHQSLPVTGTICLNTEEHLAEEGSPGTASRRCSLSLQFPHVKSPCCLVYSSYNGQALQALDTNSSHHSRAPNRHLWKFLCQIFTLSVTSTSVSKPVMMTWGDGFLLSSVPALILRRQELRHSFLLLRPLQWHCQPG